MMTLLAVIGIYAITTFAVRLFLVGCDGQDIVIWAWPLVLLCVILVVVFVLIRKLRRRFA